MTIAECISDMLSSIGDIFETNQEKVIKDILRAEKVVFLDTCFITKCHNLKAEKTFEAFEMIAEGRDNNKIVFVVTELVLYELKDSAANELQAKNREYFEKMSNYGFTLLALKEESVCDNIRPFMSYSNKKWNEVFAGLIHDNVANLSFNRLVRTDNRMPYFGFSENDYNVPADRDFIRDIILYLKNAKRNKDSMAEELVCTSLFLILELTHGSGHSEYIFCSHDFGAIARMNKAIQTSYPKMQEHFKKINVFGLVQFMIKNEIITYKDEAAEALRKIMGPSVRLIIGEDVPFAPTEKEISVEEAVEKMFDGERVELLGQRD